MTQPDAGLISGDPLNLDNERYEVTATLQRPRLALLENLLSIRECESVIEDASNLMRRSEVIDDDNAGTSPDPTRTSSGMYFEPGASSVADQIQCRLMALAGMPQEHGEPLQVLRYGPGEVYEPHFDFFDDSSDSPSSTVALHGQRVGTVICYPLVPGRTRVAGCTGWQMERFEATPKQKPAQSRWTRHKRPTVPMQGSSMRLARKTASTGASYLGSVSAPQQSWQHRAQRPSSLYRRVSL